MTREDQFKDMYVASFMASWKAIEWTDRGLRGPDEIRHAEDTVEAAEDEAEKAWEAMKELSPRLKQEDAT